jgi:hypothetical protein
VEALLQTGFSRILIGQKYREDLPDLSLSLNYPNEREGVEGGQKSEIEMLQGG